MKRVRLSQLRKIEVGTVKCYGGNNSKYLIEGTAGKLLYKGEVFCLMAHRVTFMGESNVNYSIWFSPKKVFDLTRAEASLIKQNYDLHVAFQNANGKIYDNENNDFLKKYKGWSGSLS